MHCLLLLKAVFWILIIQDVCLNVVTGEPGCVGEYLHNSGRKSSDVDLEGRVRRADLPTIHIETVVILDEAYIQYLEGLGHTTEEAMKKTMQLKWNGAQAEFGRADVFGYHIYIDIKLIEFWHNNPSWYSPSSELDDTLSNVCYNADKQNMYLNYDLIYLFTGVDNPDVSGKAYTGRICKAGKKCGLSAITGIPAYTITTHEIGHSLGMAHDVDVGCPSPNDGIMGSKSSGWSSCSVNAARTLLQGNTVGCLFETNVDTGTVMNLTASLPGMLYTDDDICELKHGPGHVFRPFPYAAWGECTVHTCWNMNVTSPDYGRHFNHFVPPAGRYCGDRQICSTTAVSGAYPCITWEETGLDLALFEVVDGQWSAWGPWSECGRSCGTGVRYRQRSCDSPKPKLSPPCAGPKFDAVLCNKMACDDDATDRNSLIKQRADEVCAHLKHSGWYGEDTEHFKSTGNKYNNQGDGQCEVRCDPVQGYSPSTFMRFGLMSDGTPCSSGGQSFVDKHNLPRGSGGYNHHCVRGLCYAFDCTDTSNGGNTIDECGVCGGDNTTCDYTHGVFNTTLKRYASATVTELPPGAYLIQFYFDYGKMEAYLLELWTIDGQAVIAPFENNIWSTNEVPVTWAGTRWHYDYAVQYMYADDPINTSAIVKVMPFKEEKENLGIFYSFSVPKVPVAVGEDCTNTYCRDQHAVCDTNHTCSCKIGYVYTSGNCTVETTSPTFLVPNPTGSTAAVSASERTPEKVTILAVRAEDRDGDILTFSITSQIPPSPPFSLDGASGLFTTPPGLDAETTTQYSFIFSVTDGSTTIESVVFTVNINDVDEFEPVFHNLPYSTSFFNNINNGYEVFIVTATDADVTPNTVTYSIIGGNLAAAFDIANTTGVITVSDQQQLNNDHTYTLIIQASSNGRTVDATVSITVNGTLEPGATVGEDCTDTFCRDQDAVCDTSHTCTCKVGYVYNSTNCIDFNECNDTALSACVPGEMGGQCTNTIGSYTCSCADGYTGSGIQTCVPIKSLHVLPQTVFVLTYMTLIVVVAVHSILYLRRTSCTNDERVFSWYSVASCVVLLIWAVVYIVAILIDANKTNCGVLSYFIQLSCVGYFIVGLLETITTYLSMGPNSKPRCPIYIIPALLIGLPVIAVIVHTALAGTDVFYLDQMCWYDVHHASFITPCVVIALFAVVSVALDVVLISKLQLDSKTPAERRQQRFLRSILRRNVGAALWHAVVWLLQIVAVTVLEWSIPVFLITLNMEGLGWLSSRWYIFSYVCRKSVLNTRTKDTDHPDFPSLHENGAGIPADMADVCVEVKDVTYGVSSDVTGKVGEDFIITNETVDVSDGNGDGLSMRVSDGNGDGLSRGVSDGKTYRQGASPHNVYTVNNNSQKLELDRENGVGIWHDTGDYKLYYNDHDNGVSRL